MIHAAKGMTRIECEEALDWCAATLGLGVADSALAFPKYEAFERGGFIGVARLVDVIQPCRHEPGLFEMKCPHRWHMPEQYGFVLKDIQPLPFVPYKGELGFFEVPDHALKRDG